MIFQLQITVQSIEEAERVLASLKHSADPAVVQQVEGQIPAFDGEVSVKGEPVAEKPKNPRGRPRRQVADPLPESAAPSASLPEKQGPAPAPESEPEVEGQAARQTYTRDDVRQALMDLQAKTPGDMTGALAMLEKFKAGRVSEVAEADFAKFIAACKAA